MLNLQKIKLRLREVPFMGHLLTVGAIRDMSTYPDRCKIAEERSWHGYLPSGVLTNLIQWVRAIKATEA